MFKQQVRSITNFLRMHRAFLIFAGVIMVIFVLLAPVLLPPAFANGDFFQFWLAGKMNWLNLDPYNADDWNGTLLSYGNTWIPEDYFNYPLPLFRLLAPLGLLPVYPAYMLWDALSLLAVVVGIYLLFSMYKPHKNLWFPAICGALVSRPLLVILRNGQITAFIFFILVVGITLCKQKRCFWGGFLLGFSALKPQIGVVFLVMFGFWLLVKRNWNGLLGLLTSTVFISSIGFVTKPSWPAIFLNNSGLKLAFHLGMSPTLWGLLWMFIPEKQLIPVGISIALVIILLLLLILIKFKERLDHFSASGWIILVTLFVTPYTWAYDQLLLLIPLGFISLRIAKLKLSFFKAAIVVPVFSLISVLMLIFALQVGSDRFGGGLTLAVFLLFSVLFLSRDQKPIETEHPNE